MYRRHGAEPGLFIPDVSAQEVAAIQIGHCDDRRQTAARKNPKLGIAAATTMAIIIWALPILCRLLSSTNLAMLLRATSTTHECRVKNRGLNKFLLSLQGYESA